MEEINSPHTYFFTVFSTISFFLLFLSKISFHAKIFMDFPICILLLLLIFFVKANTSEAQTDPLTCSDKIRSCNALLYQHNGFRADQVASLYSVNASQIEAISYPHRQDYLVSVNCSCQNVSGTLGYFYDVVYRPRNNDILFEVSRKFFSGQVWIGQNATLDPRENKTLYLVCGCLDTDSQVVVTYTVQTADTLSSIGALLSAEVDGIERLNTFVKKNPSFIQEGWLLYVPMEKYGLPGEMKGEKSLKFCKSSWSWFWSLNSVYLFCCFHSFLSVEGTRKVHKWLLLLGILSAVAVLSVCTLVVVLFWRRRSKSQNVEDPKSSLKQSSTRARSMQRNYTQKEITEGYPSSYFSLYWIWTKRN